MMRIPYKVYHLMYVSKLSCTCRKRIKGRKKTKEKETKEKKQKLDTRNKVKSENKINIIFILEFTSPATTPKT